jgi:dolichyl-phosphate-mannose--protein O-mannosyl transferase
MTKQTKQPDSAPKKENGKTNDKTNYIKIFWHRFKWCWLRQKLSTGDKDVFDSVHFTHFCANYIESKRIFSMNSRFVDAN